MNAHADKTQENKIQSMTNAISKRQNGSKQAIQFVDNRPEAIAQRKLQEMANNSPRVKQLMAYQEMANNSPQAQKTAQLQKMVDSYYLKQQPPIQQKTNNTGLPENLKTGIESLSGYAMDDVKVHYNSDKPAQLHAHAYAQGTDIHIIPGKEQHLPHEAWHVVQQMQGRVQPTMQAKGLRINDSPELENEASRMGEKAAKIATEEVKGSSDQSLPIRSKSTLTQQVVQPFWLEDRAGIKWDDEDIKLTEKVKTTRTDGKEFETLKYKDTGKKRWKSSYKPSFLGLNEELPIYREKTSGEIAQEAKEKSKTERDEQKKKAREAEQARKDKISANALAEPNLWVVDGMGDKLKDFLAACELTVEFSSSSKTINNIKLIKVQKIETNSNFSSLPASEQKALKKFIAVMHDIKSEAWITFGSKLKYGEIQTLAQVNHPNMSLNEKAYQLSIFAHEVYENAYTRKEETAANDYWGLEGNLSGYKAAHSAAIQIENSISAEAGIGRRIGQIRKPKNPKNAFILLEKGALLLNPTDPTKNKWIKSSENQFLVAFASASDKTGSSTVYNIDDQLQKAKNALSRVDTYCIVKGDISSNNRVYGSSGDSPSHFVFNEFKGLSLNNDVGTTRLAKEIEQAVKKADTGAETVEIIVYTPDNDLIQELL